MTSQTGFTESQPKERAGLRIGLLSGFEVAVPGGRLEFPTVASRLIAYLALQERPVSRTAISGVLWPESTQDRAQASLRSTLWRVRKIHTSIITSSNECLSLTEDSSVDANAVIALARGLDAGESPPELGAVPVTWFSFELLPDWYEDWVAFERERFRLIALHALESLARWYVKASQFGPAIYCALAAVRLEPLRESSHRALIEAHLAEGNAAEAIFQYRSYRRLLYDELGIEPSEQMERLFQLFNLHPAPA